MRIAGEGGGGGWGVGGVYWLSEAEERQGPEKGRGPRGERTQRPHRGRKGIIAVQSEDSGDLHPSVATQRLHSMPCWRRNRAGVQGFLGLGIWGGGPQRPELCADFQLDAVIAKPHGQVLWAHPGCQPGREEGLMGQNLKVKGPRGEDAGSQLGRGSIGGYSMPNT